MKVTLAQVQNSITALGWIMTQQMPATDAFAFARLVREVNAELKLLGETRNQLAAQYGGEWKEGEWKFADSAKEKEFDAEIVKLLEAAEVELNVKPMRIDQFPEKMSPLHAFALDWLIES